jgi:hypothetical protein
MAVGAVSFFLWLMGRRVGSISSSSKLIPNKF